MMRTLSVWIIERLAEILFVTVTIMVIARPLESVVRGGLVEEFLRTAVFPLAFYIFSGYILSCIVFGIFLRGFIKRRFALVMSIVYAVHFGLFYLISGASFEPQVVVAGAIALFFVFLIHWIGSIAISRQYP